MLKGVIIDKQAIFADKKEQILKKMANISVQTDKKTKFVEKIPTMKENFINPGAVSKAERLRLVREYHEACECWFNDRSAGKVRIVWLSFAGHRDSSYLITDKEYDFAREQFITTDNPILSAFVSDNGKYGLVDMDGHEILPCRYDKCGAEIDGKRWMGAGGRWRVFDIATRKFSAESYPGDKAVGSLLVQRDGDGKYGAINFDGILVVPFEYEAVTLSDIGPIWDSWRYSILVLTVREEREPYYKEFFRLATPDGKLYSDEIYDICPYQWEGGEYHPCTDWSWSSYGPTTITRRESGGGTMYGLLNLETEKLVLPCECRDLEYWCKVGNVDLYRYVRDGFCGVIDENGNEIIPLSMCLSGIGSYPHDEKEYLIRACRDGKWGYINIEAVEKIPFQYDSSGIFSEGKACVEVKGHTFVIDRHGRFVSDLPETD